MEAKSHPLELFVRRIVMREVKMKRDQKRWFDTAWAQIQELIDDPEFGEQCEQGMSDEAQDNATRLLMALDLDTGLDADVGDAGEHNSEIEKLVQLIGSAAEDMYYAEGSSGFPGSTRSGHRRDANKYKTLVKNRLRVLVGAESKGLTEHGEIEAFIAEYLAQNADAGRDGRNRAEEQALAERFPELSNAMRADLAMWCFSNRNVHDEFKKEIIEHAAILLHDARKRRARVSPSLSV